MKKILNITKRIVDLVIILLIIILITLTLSNKLNKENVTKIGNYYIFFVASGSMEPTLNIGDVMISKESNEYKEGDIITYKLNKNYITHRIVKINKDEIITKGDANKVEDVPIKKEQIKSKYHSKSKVLKTIYTISKNPLLMTLTIVIILLINILDYLIDDRKDDKNETI